VVPGFGTDFSQNRTTIQRIDDMSTLSFGPRANGVKNRRITNALPRTSDNLRTRTGKMSIQLFESAVGSRPGTCNLRAEKKIFECCLASLTFLDRWTRITNFNSL